MVLKSALFGLALLGSLALPGVDAAQSTDGEDDVSGWRGHGSESCSSSIESIFEALLE